MGPYRWNDGVSDTDSSGSTSRAKPGSTNLMRCRHVYYGLNAIQRVQPGEPVAGNPLGGFCGGREQERVLKTRPYPPQSGTKSTASGREEACQGTVDSSLY